MTSPLYDSPSMLPSAIRQTAVSLTLLCQLALVALVPALAQNFTVLHTFTGGQDGGNPYAGVTIDGAGNLYGTTIFGGTGYGTVYQLKHRGTGWVSNPLYAFSGGSDGAVPWARVVFGPNGTLYGTTYGGGSGACSGGCGTIFNLRPQARACITSLCPWTEAVLHRFNGSDGNGPGFAEIVFDQAGNMYGTTVQGGSNNFGTAYQLASSGTESVIYNFASGTNGYYPYSSLIFDNAGSLYSTTRNGGAQGCTNGCGTVFRLTYSGGWFESPIHTFQNGSDASLPLAGLILDPSGNLYGATTNGGAGGGGTVFELSTSGGGFTTLYSFTGGFGCGPWASVVMDAAGNLYGTTHCDGANGLGSVFKLTRSGNNWIFSSLHDFTGGSDGKNPVGNVTLDANGNLYGTAYGGGAVGCADGCGVVWEITP